MAFPLLAAVAQSIYVYAKPFKLKLPHCYTAVSLYDKYLHFPLTSIPLCLANVFHAMRFLYLFMSFSTFFSFGTGEICKDR